MNNPGALFLGLLSLMMVPVTTDAMTRDEIDGFLGADNQFYSSKGINWSVLPGPFYTPELKLGLGTAIAGVYCVDPNDRVAQNSSVSFTGFVSTSGALGGG